MQKQLLANYEAAGRQEVIAATTEYPGKDLRTDETP